MGMQYFTQQIEQPYRKVTEHSITLSGEEIKYQAIAEDHIIAGEDDNPAYSIFTFSYIRTNGEPNRPVIFFFNGGPGSSSAWLHMAFYGPRIMKLDEHGMPMTDGPFELRDNKHCLLDLCDLVAIDPVDAGYSRLFDNKYQNEFVNDMPDAVSVSKAIREWIRKYHREDSVKYISGESFGSTRASLLAYLLRDLKPIGGEIHIGPGYTGKIDPARNVKDLIPLAATRWYYDKAPKKPALEDWMKECYDFLYQQYLAAYHLGSDCPDELYRSTAEKLSYFTDISADFYLDNGLWIDREYFRSHFLIQEQKKLGSFDTRFTLPLDRMEDPFLAAFDPPVEGTRELYFRQELGIDFDREYRAYSHGFSEEFTWEFQSEPDMAGANALAYKENPQMRFFFGTGWYDSVATVENTRFAVTHTDIPREAVTMINYESGHAVYADETSRIKLAQDIRKFILDNPRTNL